MKLPLAKWWSVPGSHPLGRAAVATLNPHGLVLAINESCRPTTIGDSKTGFVQEIIAVLGWHEACV